MKLEGVSEPAVQKATGKTWTQWVKCLDAAGAHEMSHKQIVAHLKANFELSPWWQQTVTVGYEKAKGRRVIGQTADAGFQLGIQRTSCCGAERVWKFLTSKTGVAIWLGDVTGWKLVEGFGYQTSDGSEGEIRVVKPKSRLRLTWKTTTMKRAATLQWTLSANAAGRTSLRLHIEKLASAKMREQMKKHWNTVLDQLIEAVDSLN